MSIQTSPSLHEEKLCRYISRYPLVKRKRHKKIELQKIWNINWRGREVKREIKRDREGEKEKESMR